MERLFNVYFEGRLIKTIPAETKYHAVELISSRYPELDRKKFKAVCHTRRIKYR